MRRLTIADITLSSENLSENLSFKNKIDLAGMLDRLEVDRIELPAIQNPKADSLLIKSIASVVKQAELSVALPLTGGELALTVKALAQAKRARLALHAPLSVPQMEYIYHKKPKAMLELITQALGECTAAGLPVEFVAEDATRANPDFVREVLELAISKGACAVTLRDDAGKMLPNEMTDFLRNIRAGAVGLEKLPLALYAGDGIGMAEACAVAALSCGISELKVSSFPAGCISLQSMVKLLSVKNEDLGVYCGVRGAEIQRLTQSIARLCSQEKEEENSPAPAAGEGFLTREDSRETVMKVVRLLGYEASPQEENQIWIAFENIIAKKDRLSYRELDAIIAAEAMQVPAAYTVDSYMISTGNGFSSMAHMKLLFHGEKREGVAVGGGVIEAAFSAIEKAVGRHFALEDFRIQAVTEGREAVGRTLIKLRAEGKLYSGQGISTDIVEASIAAYISAMNKIVFEEEEA